MASSKAKASSSTSNISMLSNIYLFSYNFIQVIGWSYLLYQLINHYASGQSNDSLWQTVKLTVLVFQNAAVLEIVNVAIGLVKSNLMITSVQVYSRLMVVLGILVATPTAPLSPGLPLALIAWSITEIIRYLYYSLNIINLVPYLLIWTREAVWLNGRPQSYK